MNFVRIVVVAFSMSCACFGQSARDIAQVAFKSVVLLEMNDSNGQPLSLGSGFFVSNGIIATNAHVIEGASSGTAKLVGDTHTLQILGTVAVDRHADLALLKVKSNTPPLVLSPNTSPAVGDNVYVVGNPLGLEGTFSEGIISAVRHFDGDSILQMTAPISPGSSGGPVMDSSGAVIGIAVATFQRGQNLNLAMPVKFLSK
jgi:S1-C subfamily serine protease